MTPEVNRDSLRLTERQALSEQWHRLAGTTLIFAAVNTFLTDLLLRNSFLEGVLHLLALVAGLGLQRYLFFDRFFLTSLDRRLFEPGRFAVVFGGAFKEGFPIRSFLQKGGEGFIGRILVGGLGGLFLFFSLSASNHFSLLSVLYFLLFATCLQAADFWRPVGISMAIAALVTLSVKGTASATSLVVFLIAGLQWLSLAATHSFLEERVKGGARQSLSAAPLPYLQWLPALLVFVVITTVVFPFIPRKRVTPPKNNFSQVLLKRFSHARVPTPGWGDDFEMPGGGNSESTGGSGQSTESEARSDRHSGRGGPPDGKGFEGATMGEGAANKPGKLPEGTANQGGESTTGSQPPESSAADSETGQGQEPSANAGNGASGERKAAGDGKGGPAGDGDITQLPAKNRTPAAPTLPKLPDIAWRDLLKRWLPALVVGLLTLLAVAELVRRERKRLATVRKAPKVSPKKRRQSLSRLEAELHRLAEEEAGSADAVVRVYNAFIAFLAEQDLPRPDCATPDEFAYEVLSQCGNQRIHPVTQLFCNTFYGGAAPSREEFLAFLTNVRAIARTVLTDRESA